jgi:hypothetical protein
MRALLVVLVVAACGKDAGPKIVLRYHPPAGAVYHYALEQETRVVMPSTKGPLAGGIRQEMRLRVYSTQTVKGPGAGGGTEVEIVIDSAAMIMPGLSPDLARQVAAMRGSRSTIVFGDRLQMVRSDLSALKSAPPEVTNQMMAVLKGMAYEFPEQPVGRGDSWTVSMDLPIEQFGGVDASKAGRGQTTLTVRSVQATGPDTSVVLDIKSTFPTGPIQLTIMGQRGSMTLSGEMTGYQEFSISRGTVVDTDVHGNSTINVTVPTLEMREMAVTTETASSIRLAGARTGSQ